jgi:hypothetical protein
VSGRQIRRLLPIVLLGINFLAIAAVDKLCDLENRADMDEVDGIMRAQRVAALAADVDGLKRGSEPGVKDRLDDD